MSYPQSPNLCEPATVSDAIVVGGGGTDVTCCQVGTKICCARLDQVCWKCREAKLHHCRICLHQVAHQRSTLSFIHTPEFLKCVPRNQCVLMKPSWHFISAYILYLCDDSRSDLYGLDWGCLCDQWHRSLHSNRVACWFSCVGGDSCWVD